MSDSVPPPPPAEVSPQSAADATNGQSTTPFIPAPAPLKPLLNPLQQEGSAPGSTIVEPPRSPNPANPAAGVAGANGQTDGPVPGAVNGGESVANGSAPAAAAPAPTPSAPVADQPPLPVDAPVPPSPPAPADEPVPTLPASAIPSAVPTPTVIEVRNPLETSSAGPTPAPASGSVPTASVAATEHVAPPSVEQPAAPVPTPSPAPVSTPAVAPALPSSASTSAAAPAAPAALPPSASLSPAPLPTSTPNAAHPPSDGMDLDADGEDEVSAPVSTPSLKRSGDDLAGPDEKRIRETNAAPAPAHPSVATPLEPGIGYVPLNYTPPAPRPAGPRTLLTATQHRHLLNTIRSLKKTKEAVNFLVPVDVVLFNIPHYYNTVKKPMDLGTIETKLIVSNPRGPPKDKSKMGNWDESKGKYHSVAEVTEDVRQVWENTRMFNGPDHAVTQNAGKLETIYEKALKNIPPEPVSAAPSPVHAAGPSAARRPSISHPPAPRRSEDSSDRPKREIHPPPPKELPYNDAPRKPKRRADPQVSWCAKQIKSLESKMSIDIQPFLYPVGDLAEQVAGYADRIKKPIDLLIIKAKLNEGEYEDAKDINKDMLLMTNNALSFNPPDHPVYSSAKALQQAWKAKFKELPPKEVPRGLSEDIGVDEMLEEVVEDDFEDDPVISILRQQLTTIEKQMEDRRVQIRKERGITAPTKKSKPAPQRKSSTAAAPKRSPAPPANGHHVAPATPTAPAPKKPRKSKEISYKEDDDAYGESDEEPAMSMTQKQELAEKIQVADGDTLGKAIKIIQQSTGLDGANDEIELDIDSLPPKVVSQLYNLVCRGGAPRRSTAGRPKNQSAVVAGKKPGRKATGGYSKRMMNEQEEADRIARMEAQLQTFNEPSAAGNGGYETESSDEDESDEE